MCLVAVGERNCISNKSLIYKISSTDVVDFDILPNVATICVSCPLLAECLSHH